MSKNPKKKEQPKSNDKIIKKIIDVQKYIKNEDVFKKIQEKTFHNLDQKKKELENKYNEMCRWHYFMLHFIKNKSYSPSQFKDNSSLIEQACEIKTFEGIRDPYSKNKESNKTNLDISKSIVQENETLYFTPEFIYFISKSFRSIFMSSKSDLKFIKSEMLKSWKRNKDYIPSDIWDSLTENEQYSNQKLRNLFKLIFENPELFQITYFYQNKLTDELISKLLISIDDEYCSEFFKLKDINNSKLKTKSSSESGFSPLERLLENSRMELNEFSQNFKSLLIYSDLLPEFPKSYFNEINDLEQFISENLVNRGNLRNYKKRFVCFSKMQEFVKKSQKTMNSHLSRYRFDNLTFEHRLLNKEIKLKLNYNKKESKKYMEIINIPKQTSYVLKFNYVNSIVQMYYIQKKNESKNSAKKAPFISGLFNFFTKKTSENDNENSNDHKDDETLFNISEVIKDPTKLKGDYQNILDIKEYEHLFKSDGSLKKENDREIEYDWKTFLIFSLLKDVTFDKFLECRPEVTIFDRSYTNMYYATLSKTMEEEEINDESSDDNDNDNNDNDDINNEAKLNKMIEQNEEEDSDVENSDDNDNNDNDDINNEAKLNKKIEQNKEEEEESDDKNSDDNESNNEVKLDNLVLELNNAFSSITNPIQKILDIYNSLKEINNFFTKEGNDLFVQKLNEHSVNKVENTGWNIPFNIFDFVCLPNFVSSMIFIFDYYFLLFGRNSKLKMLFLQIYNYAIKKNNSNDQLHFDIISNEEDLYQHLLLCRKQIKMIFVGNNEKGQTKNIILKNILKNSISGKYEENEVFPLDEFISNTKEITCHFFKDSTFYICTILLFSSVEDEDLKKLHLEDNKNKNQFAAFLISVDKPNDKTEVTKFVGLINNINLTHVICNPGNYASFLGKYKNNAIIHSLKTFDIKNIKIFN